jgi:hypothetical protein
VLSEVPKVRQLAGQSIRDQKEVLTDNWLIPLCFAFVFSWLLWAWEEFKAYGYQPPSPKVLLGLAIILTGVTAIALRRLFGKFRNLNRGERGEIKVAEVLEELRCLGYRPFHGLSYRHYDIDHVVVGPAGVFVIETKFRSGHGEIEFRDGDGLFVGDRKQKDDPLKQARSNARDVNRLLKEYCRRYFWVTPVVVFVGDWKIKNNWQTTEARVFTPDRLLSYFEELQPTLVKSEIEMIASHLDRSVKSRAQRRRRMSRVQVNRPS